MAAIVDSTPPSRLWNKGKVGVGRVKVHFDVKHNQSYKRTALNIFDFLDSILCRGCPIVMMQVSTEEVEFVGSSNLTLQPLYRVVVFPVDKSFSTPEINTSQIGNLPPCATPSSEPASSLEGQHRGGQSVRRRHREAGELGWWHQHDTSDKSLDGNDCQLVSPFSIGPWSTTWSQ